MKEAFNKNNSYLNLLIINPLIMKKITLLFLLFYTSISIGQILDSENFESLTLGNVGTDISGTTPGQGGYLTFTSSGKNSDFQIINSGSTNGKTLKLFAEDNTDGVKYIWKDGLNTAWSSRTGGNNIIQIEYDIFTGPTTTTEGVSVTQLYNSSYSIEIAGILFVPETKVLLGRIYIDNAGIIDTYSVNLGSGGSEIILAANTWYRIGFAFDKTTGEVTFRGPGFYVGGTGAATGIDPFEFDFVLIRDPDSFDATEGVFDNLQIKATATENLLLSTEERIISETVISIYPNPVNEILNFSLSDDLKLSKYEIVDINGRSIISNSITKTFNNKISVLNLSNGVYLLNLYSDQGKTTKKFIKN